MKVLAKEFYAYIQLEDDKKNKSPISNRIKVMVVIKAETKLKKEEAKKEEIETVLPPAVNVEKLFAESMNANPEIPLMERHAEAKQNALKA